MSWDAVGHVVAHSRHKGSELLVLILLANHAGSDGWECWPSVRLLAAESRITDRQVRRCLRALESSGEIRSAIGGGPHGSNLYRIVGQPALDLASVSGGKDVRGDTHVRKGGTPMSPESEVEPSVNPLRAERARPRDELFEALADVEGADLSALTRSARGKLNAATKQLREVDATADDVRARAAIYRRKHPTWELTAPSLVKFWPSLNGSVADTRPTPDAGLDDSWLFPEVNDA